MLKKILLTLTVFIVSISLFSGCMGTGNNTNSTKNGTGSNLPVGPGTNVATTTKEKLEVLPISEDKIPQGIKTLAKESKGKLSYFAAEYDGKFYVILSSSDERTYGISQAEILKIDSANYIAINIVEKSTQKANAVNIYQVKTSKMPTGILFQKANDRVATNDLKTKNNVVEDITKAGKDVVDKPQNSANKATKNNNPPAPNDGNKRAPNQIIINAPKEGLKCEASPIKVIGHLSSDSGKVDKVYLVMFDKNNKIFGKSESLVADLDQQFATKLKYTIPSNIAKDANGYTDAIIKVYTKHDGIDDLFRTVNVKIK